jgi:hypothetical protein
LGGCRVEAGPLSAGVGAGAAAEVEGAGVGVGVGVGVDVGVVLVLVLVLVAAEAAGAEAGAGSAVSGEPVSERNEASRGSVMLAAARFCWHVARRSVPPGVK